MSDWGDITPISEGDQGWGDITPANEAPKYKPDPVVAPSPAFMKRFAQDEEKKKQDAMALLDAFKQTYGDQPMVSWRPEDIKTLQDWGLLNSPENSNPKTIGQGIGSFFRSFTDPVLKAIPAIPDTVMRSINGLAGMGSELIGQGAADVTKAAGGSPQAQKKAHDTGAGMSWEAVQAWFLYEMSNGAGFGRVQTGPLGTEKVEPVGTLPRQSSFDNAATILGSKEIEPNVKQVYNKQGITPAEIVNDAQKNVTITQDVVTGRDVAAYQAKIKTTQEWVDRNISDILTKSPEEFKAEVKAAGVDYNEAIDYIAAQPEVAGRWTDALNQRAVEARVRELHPEAYDLYQTLEEKKLEASNAVEELKQSKYDAVYGEIDKQIEETQAKLTAEGGQGKRYKVYQKRLDDLKARKAELEMTSPLGDAAGDFNRNIQAARLEWLKYDQQQRTLVPLLGKARKQAQAELEAIGPSELPLKEQEINQVSPQPSQPQQTPSQAVQNAQQQALGGQGGGVGGGGQQPPAGNVGAPGATPAPQPTLAQARANISGQISVNGKEPAEKLTWNKLYTSYVDMFNPVRVAVRDALKSVGINYKTIKNTAEDPYIWFRLTKGAFGKGSSFINYATRNFHTLQVNGYGLKEILKPVADDLPGLRDYIASRRALELEGRGVTSGFDVPSAQVVVNDPAMQAKFEPVHRQLVDFQNRITEYLKDSGIISEQAYQEMLIANQEYTPFYRHFEDTDTPVGRNVSGRLGAKNPIKGIKGGEQAIIDPLESVIRNTFTYIALADKNAAGLKLVDLMNHLNSNYLQVVPATATNGLSQISTLMRRSRADNTIAVWRDGVPEVYKVVNNPDLVKAWQGLDSYVASSLVKFLSLPSKTLRAGATLTPDFMARNFIRDMMTAMVTAGSHPIRSGEGLFHAFFKTKTFRDWQASGGSNSAMVSLDRHYLQGNIRDLLSSTNMLKSAWNGVNHPIEMLRAIGEISENATRVGAFLRRGTQTKAGMLEAGFRSREATLDFARMGTQMNAANMLDAFLNANIQGTDRIIRSFKDDPLGTIVRVAGAITVPSIMLWMANHNDPRYKNAHDWEKNLYWMPMTSDWQPITAQEAKAQGIPAYNLRTRNGRLEAQKGHVFKIPKPFELGILFGSLPERMLDEWYDREPKAIEKWSNDALGAMIPQLLPQFLTAPVEGITNYSFFTGNPVVPDHLKGLLPEYQYTEYTSETAKLLGSMIGAIPGMRNAEANPNAPLNGLAKQITSPMVLENYVQNWSGGLGMQALKIADAGLKSIGIGADKVEPETPLEMLPFVKSFMIRYPSFSPQSLKDFKAHNEENNTIMNTIKATAKAANMKEYNALLKAYGARATLNKTQDAITKQYKLIQMITASNGINKVTGKPLYSPQDKRQLIDGFLYSIDQMATQANKMLAQEDQFIAKHMGK